MQWSAHSRSWFLSGDFIYFLAVLGFHCCAGFSLVTESQGNSLAAVCELLISVASLVVEACRIAACGLSGCSSLALERRLNSSGAQA